MKTRGIVLPGLDFGKGRDAEHGTPQGVSMFDPMVDSGSVTEGKDVAEDGGCVLLRSAHHNSPVNEVGRVVCFDK
jgi:hypothetical protein